MVEVVTGVSPARQNSKSLVKLLLGYHGKFNNNLDDLQKDFAILKTRFVNPSHPNPGRTETLD